MIPCVSNSDNALSLRAWQTGIRERPTAARSFGKGDMAFVHIETINHSYIHLGGPRYPHRNRPVPDLKR